MRLLLARPLLVAGLTPDEDFRLVRAMAAPLREWFDRETGWRLHIDAQTARLFKTTTDLDDLTRPARDPKAGTPFGRQRYVLTCLALAVLERADRQITLGRLAEQILLAATDPELFALGFRFELDRREERADLVAVVRLQLDWGTLRRVGGDEESFLNAAGDVLYDVDRRVLSNLLTSVTGPSLIQHDDTSARVAAMTAEAVHDSDDLRNRALRHRLTRRLLEEPVVYYGELTEAELGYLRSQRAQITSRITEATGLIAEVRAEGIAMVDPDDELTDVRMPAQGMRSHLALLLAEHIATQPDGVPLADLHELTRQLAVKHQAYWRKDATDPGAEVDLVDAALATLSSLKLVLVQRAPQHRAVPRPAIARYALAEPEIRQRGKEATA
ncbi:TIGR02678 family protein [Catellatospora bangladeshensis]|nr:TIGR02678 family protein [Catellatospora bangladeshensis]